jgi:diguanylate cyclase (GGDEF)-like protein
MGGDEFVIVMPGMHSKQDIARIGEQILRNASQPVEISGQKVSLTLSVGISTFPEGGRTAEALLRNADTAMYASKDSGRNRLCLFEERLEMSSGRATA